MSTLRKSRKRRRVSTSEEAENIPERTNANADEQGEEKNEGEEDDASEKERAAWEAFREEFIECVERLPLSLHRNYALLKELDRQTELYLSRLLPAVRQYIDLRFSIARRRQSSHAPEVAKLNGDAVSQSAEPKVEHDNASDEILPPTPAPKETDDDTRTRTSTVPSARAVSVSTSHRDFERESSSATLPTSYDRGSKILPYISHLINEFQRAAEEKLNLSQATYDSVDRHVRLLDQAIRESETGISGGSFLAVSSQDPLASTLSATLSGEVDTSNHADASNPSSNVAGPAVGEDGSASALPAKRVTWNMDMPINPNEPRYCFCKNYSFGLMVACDNTDCKHEWFHLECVGLTAVPQEEVWYCEECEEALGIRSSRRKKGR